MKFASFDALISSIACAATTVVFTFRLYYHELMSPNRFNPFCPACATFLQRYNSPADWAWKLFKPSTDSASLLVEIEKKFFVLGLGFSVGDVTMRACFCVFDQIYPAMGANPMSIFW